MVSAERKQACVLVLLLLVGLLSLGLAGRENGFREAAEGLVRSSDYKSNWLTSAGGFSDGLGSSSKIADAQAFAALTGENLSMARTDFGPKGLNPPHKHPNVTEVLFVAQGTLLVGFIHTANNTLYQQTLSTGDLFIFPRGLVHFQLNMDMEKSAMAISALNSATPGVSQSAAFLP